MRSKPIVLFVLFVFCMSFAGCFTSDNPADETAVPTTPTDRALGLDSNSQISISTSQASVKTDNSDKATITATVIDTDNSVVEGAVVSFSASGGQLSAGSATTNKDGQASVDFSCGTIERSNRVVTIEASVEGLGVRLIPIQVVGTTIDIDSHGTTSLAIDGQNSDNLTVTVKDAGGLPIYNAAVSLSLASTSTGSVSFSPQSGNCGVDGTLGVSVKAVANGSATLNVSALGATSSIIYTVNSTVETFAIQSPTDEIVSLSTGETLTVKVFNPFPGDSNIVVFGTSFGSWGDGSSVFEVTLNGDKIASAELKSDLAGVATIQVFDKDTPSVTDILTVAFSAPSGTASIIDVQSDFAIVAPSTDTVKNEVRIVSTVKNSSGQIVGGAPVSFSIEKTTGGGESIYPTIAFTDDYGVVNATFRSGSKSSSAEGVKVVASLVDFPAIRSSTDIVIGGTAASIALGRATHSTAINSETAYRLPMSVLVVDSNGNPMANAVVSISSWPVMYSTGYNCACDSGPTFLGDYENEDRNRDFILNTTFPPEDQPLSGPPSPNHGDGALTPSISAAGTVPSTVTTDETGIAMFNLTYLKQYAWWTKVEIKASAIVMGPDVKSTLEFWLPAQEDDGPYIPDSPFNPTP